MTNRFSQVEREALCDLALDVGPDAPTLSGDWTVKDLVVHLLVRERTVLGAPGILFKPLSGLTDRASERMAEDPFDELVERLRHPVLTWAAIPFVDAVVNASEYFIHHEDIRRARPGWAPRTMSGRDNDVLWRIASIGGRGLVRSAGVPIRIERTDTGDTSTLVRGDEAVTIQGPPSEIVMFLYGRDEYVDLTLEGRADLVPSVEPADFGI